MPRAIEHEISHRHDGAEDQELCYIDHGDLLGQYAPGDVRQAPKKGMNDEPLNPRSVVDCDLVNSAVPQLHFALCWENRDWWLDLWANHSWGSRSRWAPPPNMARLSAIRKCEAGAGSVL